MNAKKVKNELIYGIEVYTITTDNKIPYQLSFERDLFFDRINVHLIPLVHPEKNLCKDLRQLVCQSFVDYMDRNPLESVYFDMDISQKKGQLTLIKFLRWAQEYAEKYEFKFNLTQTPAIQYMEIYIQKA